MTLTGPTDGYVVVPMGGVHPEILAGNMTRAGGFDRQTTESVGVKAGHPYRLPSGSRKRVEAPQSLEYLLDCESTGGIERVVSRKVGKRRVVGARNLLCDEVEDIFEDRGLELWTFSDLGDGGEVPYRVALWRPAAPSIQALAS